MCYMGVGSLIVDGMHTYVRLLEWGHSLSKVIETKKN